MDIKKKQQFLAAVRSVPAHTVAKALGRFTPGVNWYGCSKGLMARNYAQANDDIRCAHLEIAGPGSTAKAPSRDQATNTGRKPLVPLARGKRFSQACTRSFHFGFIPV